jgi:hypothetical protein
VAGARCNGLRYGSHVFDLDPYHYHRDAIAANRATVFVLFHRAVGAFLSSIDWSCAIKVPFIGNPFQAAPFGRLILGM